MIITCGRLKQVGRYTVHVVIADDLGKYLRQLFLLANHRCQKLLPPANGYHITVNDSRDDHLILSREYEISLTILLEPNTNGNAWWYPVVSTDLEQVRLNGGLSRNPAIDFHYCIGYEREGKQVV